MRAIVLAAGFATRLYPLTRDRAKPLLEVGGRAVLSHVLDRAVALPDLRGVVVVSNARFAAQFEQWAASYPCPVPITIVDDGATDNDNRRGALADLRLGIDAVPPEARGEDLLVMSGDNLLDFELTALNDAFTAHGDPVVLCRRMPEGVPPGRHGEVCADAAGVVTSFREKPMDPRSDLAATSLYRFPADIAGDLARYLATDNNPDAPGHFLSWLVGRRRVRAVPASGRLFDIGDADSLARARREFGAERE